MLKSLIDLIGTQQEINLSICFNYFLNQLLTVSMKNVLEKSRSKSEINTLMLYAKTTLLKIFKFDMPNIYLDGPFSALGLW